MKAVIGWLLLLCFGIGSSMTANASGRSEVLQFKSLDPSMDVALSGRLTVPEITAHKTPAVIIVHSTGGVDGTGAFYRDALTGAGLATFEVDFKAGVFRSSMDRPRPDTFVPMGFAALRRLRSEPGIDPDRIGIMGFSLGAILTVNTMIDENRMRWLGSEKGFAAFAAVYPDCRFLAQRVQHASLQDAPLLVLYGSLDAYGAAEHCPRLEGSISQRLHPAPVFVMYAGAHHGFDRPGPPVTYPDPFAQGGSGHIEFNETAAMDARTRVVAFFRKWLLDAGR